MNFLIYLISFIQLIIFFLNYLLANLSENNHLLLECEYIDPVKEMENWAKFNWSSCLIKNQLKPLETEKILMEKYQNSFKNFAFNEYVSDKIGPTRIIKPLKSLQRYFFYIYFLSKKSFNRN